MNSFEFVSKHLLNFINSFYDLLDTKKAIKIYNFN